MKKRGIKTKSYSISSKGYLERFTARHKSNTMCTEQKVPALMRVGKYWYAWTRDSGLWLRVFCLISWSDWNRCSLLHKTTGILTKYMEQFCSDVVIPYFLTAEKRDTDAEALWWLWLPKCRHTVCLQQNPQSRGLPWWSSG